MFSRLFSRGAVRPFTTLATTNRRCSAFLSSYRSACFSTSSNRPAGPPTIQLTRDEEELFNLLDIVIAEYRVDVTLRVAGGWVRDKLMGGQSDDIDIAVDTMSGVQFAKFLAKYQKKRGLAVKQGIIHMNPDQSKHLETVNVHLLGFDLDIVNLREEEYTQTSRKSRIPSKTQLGTPETDAQRRDFTINALFYNLQTRTVEDFTGGLRDLEEGVLRTPLDPQITFKEDPLRVVRALRFASRFQLQLAEDCRVAMAEPAVHKIVRSKVSAERIGIEVRKIFQHPHYVTALTLASNLQLFDVLFPLTRKKSPWSPRELQEAMERVITLQRLQFGTEQPLFSARKEHQPATVLAYLLASFLPDQAHLYKAYTYGDPTQPGEYLHLGRSSLPNGVLKKYGPPDTSNAYYEMTQLVADQLRWPIAWSKLGNLLLHASQPWSQPGYAASIVSLLYSLQSSSQSSVEITPEQYTLFSGLVHNVKLAGPLYLHAICLGILCGPESASAAALTRELAVLLQDADGCPLLAKGLLNGKMLHTQFGKTQITGNFTAMLLDEALIWQILHSFQNTPLTSLQLLQHLAEQRQLTLLE